MISRNVIAPFKQGYLLKLGVIFCGLLLQPGQALAGNSYDELIQNARQADYEPALQYLRQTPGLGPNHRLDHLLIAGWAGLDAEVIQLYERYQPEVAAAADAHASAARAYRNLKQWDRALEAVRKARALAPARLDLSVLQVMILADASRSAEAVRLAKELVHSAPAVADARLALGYALVRHGEPYAALAEFDRARDLAPAEPYVLREYVFGLQRAGLPQAALDVVGNNPGLINDGERRRLEGDAVAELVRLADTRTRREAERFAIADRALTRAEELLNQWQSVEGAEADIRRLRIDRLGALHARVRMQAVIDGYRALQADGVELPPYALRWVAAALPFSRQPAEAAQLYTQVMAGKTDKNPSWVADHQALFYALVESERLDEAQALSESLARTQPKRLYPKGVPAGIANDAWLDAQALQAASLLTRDDMPQAQSAFDALSDAAPQNSGLRTSRAGIYRARGWPRLAEAELKVAESTAPRSLDVEVGQGMTALALQEWRQLDLLADDVIQRYPESLSAQRLDRLRRVHHMAELRVSGYRGLGGGSEISGSGDFGVDTVLYSPPLGQDWRVFAGTGYGEGRFVEGNGHHRWVRAGVERRVRDLTLESEVSSHGYGHGEQQGARLSAIHDLNDHWQYGASLEWLSSDTPLRALNSDIKADSVSTYVRWRANERREWQLSASGVDFSDGNDRVGLSLTGRERVHTAPYMQLDLGLDIAASRNSQGGEGPYFNPDADVTLLPSLNATHIIHRAYETVWSQQAQIGVGGYSQRDFGTGVVAVVGYGQRLQLNDRFDGGLALSATSRPYDGEREREYRLVFDVNYRF